MHNMAVGIATGALLFASACAGDSGTVNTNLECAAYISAATQLSVQGDLETDAEFDSKALYSSMTHLNTYAIPNGLSEAEAFEQLNALRAPMMDSEQPSKLLNRAKSCIRNTPKQ